MWESLKSLPRGSQPLSGITFDLRGVVVLGGQQSAMRSMTHDFPMAVTNIPVNLPATKIHFLQGAGWAGSLPHGTTIAEYHFRYADGQMATVPVRIGDEVRDWWLNDQTKRAIAAGTLAWSGRSSRDRDRELGLFSAAWTNPRPTVAITSIDVVSTQTDGALFLVAITAEP